MPAVAGRIPRAGRFTGGPGAPVPFPAGIRGKRPARPGSWLGWYYCPVHHHLGRIVWVAVLALAAEGLLGPSAAGALVPARSCGAGTIARTPTVGTFDNLYGTVAVSPQDVWAVGRYITGNSSRALVEHWAGRAWRVVWVPQPVAHNAYLYAVTPCPRRTSGR